MRKRATYPQQIPSLARHSCTSKINIHQPAIIVLYGSELNIVLTGAKAGSVTMLVVTRLSFAVNRNESYGPAYQRRDLQLEPHLAVGGDILRPRLPFTPGNAQEAMYADRRSVLSP